MTTPASTLLLWLVFAGNGWSTVPASQPVESAAGAPRRPESQAASAPHAAEYRWQRVTLNAEFAARDGAGALVFNNRMWLLGGWNPGDKAHFPAKCNSEVWSSLDGAAWKLEVRQAPWEGRHTAGYAVYRGRMWIIGGDAIQRRYQNDVWSSVDGIHWDKEADRVPWAPRVLHYTVVFNDRIWVLGGQTLPGFAPAAEAFFNDIWTTQDGKTWPA
jgi:hypothetical protein